MRRELTAAGSELVQRLAALADRNDARFFASLSREERGLLKSLRTKVLIAQGVETPPAWQERSLGATLDRNGGRASVTQSPRASPSTAPRPLKQLLES